MKIFYDHKIFGRGKYTGAARYYFELISRISQENIHETCTYTGIHNSSFNFKGLRNNKNKYLGFRMPVLPYIRWRLEAINEYLLNIFFINKFSTAKFDIYHQTSYGNFNNKIQGKKVVTVLDMIHEKYPEFYPGQDLSTKAISIKHADLIIAISEQTKNDIVEILNIPSEKIQVIYLANSLKTDCKNKPIIKEPYILYVGERAKYKNFRTLLQTFSETREISDNFKLICCGGSNFTDSEKEVISKAGIQNRVLHFATTDEILANLYKHATVFVYPSLYEGFGLPLLEAMYYGCPVITGNKGSSPEIAGNAACYFEASQADDLKQALKKVIQDTEYKSKLIENGYKREKEFSWDKCMKETINAYEHLL